MTKAGAHRGTDSSHVADQPLAKTLSGDVAK